MTKEMILVDCDDTLVLYDSESQPNPYGVYHGSEWAPNTKLIDKINALRAERDIHLCVWTGGGKDYAREWANRLFPDTWSEIAGKSRLDYPVIISLAELGIIVHIIDDMQEVLDNFKDVPNIHTYTWEEFVGED